MNVQSVAYSRCTTDKHIINLYNESGHSSSRQRPLFQVCQRAYSINKQVARLDLLFHWEQTEGVKTLTMQNTLSLVNYQTILTLCSSPVSEWCVWHEVEEALALLLVVTVLSLFARWIQEVWPPEQDSSQGTEYSNSMDWTLGELWVGIIISFLLHIHSMSN